MLHHTFDIFHIYISYLQYLKPYQNSSCVMIICCRTSSTYTAHHSLSHWQIVSSNFSSTNYTSSNIMLPHCNILPHLAHSSWHHIKPDQTLSLKNLIMPRWLIKIHQAYLLSTSSSLMISHDASSHLIIPYQAKSYFINQYTSNLPR